MVRVCMVAVLASTCATLARGQTIQLPSIHQFSVDTTVVVPDSGRAGIAGDKRAATGTSRFGGIPPQRALGTERQAAGAAAVAKIHDPRQADQALLGDAGSRGSKIAAQAAPRFNLALGGNDPGLKSVAEIKRRRAEHAAAEQRELLALVEKARQARAAGKASTAALFYRTASRQATGGLKKTIDAEWRQLTRGAPADAEPASATDNRAPQQQTLGQRRRGQGDAASPVSTE